MGGSPRRRAGSVRRTTSVDILRPDGPGGVLVLAGAGRDLATDPDGTPREVATGSTEVAIDYVGDRSITSISAAPSVAGLEDLVGVRAGSGFRRQLAEVGPELVASGSLVHLLLDEVTPTVLISGSSLAREGLVRVAADGDRSRLPFGICAGWQPGGAMEQAVVETGVPLLGWGPPAPDLVDDDPLAWHPMADLPATSLRRRRRIDLWRDGSEVLADVRYRDSYWEHDGTETVVHEYGVEAAFDADAWTVTAASAVPGPLPAPECPAAASRASDLVGSSIDEVRPVVRDRFVGADSCTHLNDVLRSLADVRALWLASGLR